MSSALNEVEIAVSSLELSIHVIGSGRGESVLLHLPDDTWGVIDCCSGVSGPDESDSNLTLRFLVAKKVESLEFLCLTHPHTDHYRGMSALLARFSKISSFWSFPSFPLSQSAALFPALTSIAQESEISAGAVGDEVVASIPKRWREDIAELRYIRNQIIRRSKAGEIELRYAQASNPLFAKRFCSADGKVADLTIRAVTPTGNDILSYYDPLNEWNDRGRTKPHPLYPDINKISSAFEVRFGETTLLLGGDALSQQWENSLRTSIPALSNNVDFVKVSHHGSSTAASEPLWESVTSPEHRTVAVITPFSSCCLPKKDFMESFFRQYADFVLVTGKEKVLVSKAAQSEASRISSIMPASIRIVEPASSSSTCRCFMTFGAAKEIVRWGGGEYWSLGSLPLAPVSVN